MLGCHEKLKACVELSKSLTETLDREEVVGIIFSHLCVLIKASNWSLFLVDHEQQELRFEIVAGLEAASLSQVRIKLGEGIAGNTALTGEEVFIMDNVENDPRFCQKVDRLTGFVTNSLICLPLKARGRVIGVLEVVNPEDISLFDETLRPILTIFSDFMAIAIINASNYKKLETLAVTDDVTGFCNTRLLHKRLVHLLAEDGEFSMAFFDLDFFKQVVDRHGHLLGSKMLREIAGLVGGWLDGDDSLIRYGGDEYVIIMPGQGKEEALAKIETIRRAMNEAIFLSDEGLAVRTTASFGVATFPFDGSSARTLLQAADNFMYQSKLKRNAITG